MKMSLLFLLFVMNLHCSGMKNLQDTTIVVDSGSDFELRLPSQIGTGYRWQLADSLDSRYLSLSNRRYADGTSDLDGGEEVEIWTFRALQKGKTTITLFYQAAWQKEQDPASKQRRVSVNIQ